MIEIREAVDLTPDLVAAFERLTPQLSSSNPPPTSGELAEIIASTSTIMFIACDTELTGPESIVGSLTLALFRIPTGLRAWIEDVVVDSSARGKGVGEALNHAAIEAARVRGARTVDLTSRPSREAANRLYQRIGFVVRDTNVYRYELS